jgi:uncharacterized membrane protein/predicted DsbA family dithiol-disulfide isomerase
MHANSKAATHFPGRLYSGLGLMLCAAGFAASAYLAVSHYRMYADIGYQSLCALAGSINCDSVSQSPYSIFWGLPVPVWGCLGYGGLAGLMFMTRLSVGGCRRIWTLSFLIAGLFSVISVLLALISTYLIKSYCILCIVTYAINLFLLFLCWIVRRRLTLGPVVAALKKDLLFALNWRALTLSLSASVSCAVLAAYLLIPPYWVLASPSFEDPTPWGMTEEGAPYIGAERPVVTISEFTDYQCFHCRKMHFFLRNLVHRFPDKLRLVHRHYPMDHEVNFIVNAPFHIGSGRMAILAIYAAAKGNFLQMNDVLYELGARGQDIDLREVADRTDAKPRELSAALEHAYYRERLRVDVAAGMKLRILGTPSFLVEGNVYQGSIPAEVLDDILRRLENR